MFFKKKIKMVKLSGLDRPAGFLVPHGEDVSAKLISLAHSCGEFLASKGTQIVCPTPRGETGIALATGALSIGGKVKIISTDAEAGPIEGAEYQSGVEEELNSAFAEVGHIWVLPPSMNDLQRYLEVWTNAAFPPLVCLDPNNEFMLLRGFVEDVVCDGNAKAAQRLIFAKSLDEGWEALSELMAA